VNTSKNKYLHYFKYIFERTWAFDRGLLLAYGTLIIVTGFLPQLDAFITGKLIDNILSRVHAPYLLAQSLATIPVILLVISSFFIMRIIYDCQSYIGQSFELKMQNFRDQLEFETLIKLPPHVYENSDFIALKNIIDYNMWKLSNIIYWTLSIFGAVFTNLFIVIVFFSYSPLILLSAIVSLVFPSIVRLKFGKQVWGIWDSLSDKKVIYGMYRSPLFQDDANKFTETKVFGYGPYLLKKFLDINNKFLDSLIRNERNRLTFTVFARILEYACVGFGFWVVFDLVLKGTVSVGSLYFLITMYAALRSSTSFTLEQLTNVMADSPFIKSLYEFLTFSPKYKVISGNTVIERKAPEIEFKDVWFKYPDTETWVLKGVSFKINKNSDIAFVGKNGAGKSTIIKLILRVYDATSGEILINGIPIKEVSIPDYYGQVGILSQEFQKFRFTAGENISIGDVYKTTDVQNQIVSAAKKAQVDEFINNYKNGYDTYLTRELKGGINPSGGQIQRIAIARVFFKNPNLIILDEPTSAIDSLAEEQIFANIKEVSHKKTVIIISHRFATVKKADYIYVLDEGFIKEHGTHEELYLKNGLYAQMYSAQSS
jgi:ATP-binding cassette subfamily B protein